MDTSEFHMQMHKIQIFNESQFSIMINFISFNSEIYETCNTCNFYISNQSCPIQGLCAMLCELTLSQFFVNYYKVTN